MPNMDATATEQQRDGMNFVQCVNLARGICKEKEKEKEKEPDKGREAHMSLWSYKANVNDNYFCLTPHFPLLLNES